MRFKRYLFFISFMLVIGWLYESIEFFFYMKRRLGYVEFKIDFYQSYALLLALTPALIVFLKLSSVLKNVFLAFVIRTVIFIVTLSIVYFIVIFVLDWLCISCAQLWRKLKATLSWQNNLIRVPMIGIMSLIFKPTNFDSI